MNITALSYTGGNVGIGAATPTAKLEVTGNAHVSTDLSVGGNLTINTISAAATHSLAAVTALGASTVHQTQQAFGDRQDERDTFRQIRYVHLRRQHARRHRAGARKRGRDQRPS